MVAAAHEGLFSLSDLALRAIEGCLRSCRMPHGLMEGAELFG